MGNGLEPTNEGCKHALGLLYPQPGNAYRLPKLHIPLFKFHSSSNCKFYKLFGESVTSNAHSSAQQKHHAMNILLNWQFHVPQKSAFHFFLALNSSILLSYQGIILWSFYPPYQADKIIDLPNFYFP